VVSSYGGGVLVRNLQRFPRRDQERSGFDDASDCRWKTPSIRGSTGTGVVCDCVVEAGSRIGVSDSRAAVAGDQGSIGFRGEPVSGRRPGVVQPLSSLGNPSAGGEDLARLTTQTESDAHGKVIQQGSVENIVLSSLIVGRDHRGVGGCELRRDHAPQVIGGILRGGGAGEGGRLVGDRQGNRHLL
jgi:hypothetical protein